MDEQSKIAGSDDPVSRLCEFQDSLLWDHFYSGPHTEYPLKPAVCNSAPSNTAAWSGSQAYMGTWSEEGAESQNAVT